MDFSVAYYSSDRLTGSISIVQSIKGKIAVKEIPLEPASGAGSGRKPILIGLAEDHQVVLLDPVSKEIQIKSSFPADSFPAHLYDDPYSSRDWFMNDGDKETGNDTLNCGDRGSSVTVVDRSGSVDAEWLGTICVGRGHHQAAFTSPATGASRIPLRAFISNLQDGTISVVGNDPNDSAAYLHVVDTINLCEPDKEDDASETLIPNHAFPHGLAFSPYNGMLYNLNNGYGTIALINPLTCAIEERVPFKGHSNLFASPDGRYLIGRGADRKSDPNHVIGKLSVFDVSTKSVVEKLYLTDIYISKYYYNPEGTKLYLTTSSSGNPQQQKNLKSDVLLVFDMTALPRLELIKELKLGQAGALAFHAVGGQTQRLFASISSSGQLVVMDGQEDEVLDTITVSPGQPHSRIWMIGA